MDLYEELHGILLLALHVANIATILVESFLKGLGAAHRGGFMESTYGVNSARGRAISFALEIP